MKQTLKYLLPALIIGLFIGTVSYGVTKIFPFQGGTGQDTSVWTGCVQTINGTWSTTTCGGIETDPIWQASSTLYYTSAQTNALTKLSNLNWIGTIATGTWQGTAIGDTWISSAATWNAKQNALTFPLAYASTTHITATSPLTISSGVLSMPTSTASISGYLSSADFTTFNAKESALTFSSPLSRSVNTISLTTVPYTLGGTGTSTALALQNLWWGDGTGKLVQVASSTLAGAGGLSGGQTNYLPLWTSATTQGTSTIFQLNSNIGIGTSTPAYTLDVYGNARADYFTTNSLVDGYYIGPYDNYKGSMYYQDDIFKFYSDSKQYAFYGLSNGFLKVDASGNVSTSTIDIGDNTNLTAGRSLTLTGDDVAADAELYTRSFSWNFTNATTTKNGQFQHSFPYNITITQVAGYTSTSTVTIQLDRRTRTTPLTAGTDIMNASLVLDNDEQATTTFATTSVVAYQKINLDYDAVGTTGIGGGLTVFYTIDD